MARLIERHFPDEGREAESCWRRSFTDGDTNFASQFWFARRLYVNGKIDDAMERFARLKLARVPFDVKVAIAGRLRENGTGKVFGGVISHLESDYAWVTPDGQPRAIYLHSSQVAANSWQSYRQGDALQFCIGVNYLGPAATFRGVAP